ncbi:MAG: hypothetical protein Alpg2KO_22180 [Alphaproteobacteria bacterium]
MTSLARTPSADFAARQRQRSAPHGPQQMDHGWEITESPGLNARLSRMDSRLVGLAGLWGTPLLLAVMLGYLVQVGIIKLSALHDDLWPVWYIIVLAVLGVAILPAFLIVFRLFLRRRAMARLISKKGYSGWKGIKSMATTRAAGPAALSLPLPPPPSTRKMAMLADVLNRQALSPRLLAMYRKGGVRLPAAGPVMMPFVMPPILATVPALRLVHRLGGGMLAGVCMAIPYISTIAAQGMSEFSDHQTQSLAAIGFVALMFSLGAVLHGALARVLQDIIHLMFDPASQTGLLLVSRDGIAMQRHDSSQILSWAALRRPERPRAGAILRPRWGGILKTGLPTDKATHLGQITARRAMFAPQEAVRAPIR